jgi:hypothetical protein
MTERVQRHRARRRERGDVRLDVHIPAGLLETVKSFASKRGLRTGEAITTLLTDALQLHGEIDLAPAIQEAALKMLADATALERRLAFEIAPVAAVANRLRGAALLDAKGIEMVVAEFFRDKLLTEAQQWMAGIGKEEESGYDPILLQKGFNRLLEINSSAQWIGWLRRSGHTLLLEYAGYRR